MSKLLVKIRDKYYEEVKNTKIEDDALNELKFLDINGLLAPDEKLKEWLDNGDIQRPV